LLFVGDSTAAQLFLAFCMLLGAKLGRNSIPTATIYRLSASACNDRVRLSFVRNDALLWSAKGLISSSKSANAAAAGAPTPAVTAEGGDAGGEAPGRIPGIGNASAASAAAGVTSSGRIDFGRCMPKVLTNPFIGHALRADMVVYSVGQHFSLLAEHSDASKRHHAEEFLARNLQYTLESTLRRGATATATATAATVQSGGWPAPSRRKHPPAVVLVGPSLPVPRCANRTAPSTSHLDTLRGESLGAEGHPYAASWRHNVRLGQLSRWVATDVGVPYVDLAEMSHLRGDGAMGYNPWTRKEGERASAEAGVP
jgi:hypothetical protein